MKNFIKIAITVSVALLISGYFFWLKPAKDRKVALANNIKCQEEGFQLAEKDKKNFLSGQGYESFEEPEFKFIAQLNTCLYKGSTLSADKSGSALRKFIKDVYSNRELAFYSSIKTSEEEVIVGDKAAYELLENKYFSR
jgi:hypothetical protein